jgi:hypothetical protein
MSLIVGLVSKSVLLRPDIQRPPLYLLIEAPSAFLLTGIGLLVAFGWRNVDITY